MFISLSGSKYFLEVFDRLSLKSFSTRSGRCPQNSDIGVKTQGYSDQLRIIVKFIQKLKEQAYLLENFSVLLMRKRPASLRWVWPMWLGLSTCFGPTVQWAVAMLMTSCEARVQDSQGTELLLHSSSQHPPGPAFPTHRLPRLPLHLAAGCLHQLSSAAPVCEQYEVCDWPLPPRLRRLWLCLQVWDGRAACGWGW